MITMKHCEGLGGICLVCHVYVHLVLGCVFVFFFCVDRVKNELHMYCNSCKVGLGDIGYMTEYDKFVIVNNVYNLIVSDPSFCQSRYDEFYC